MPKQRKPATDFGKLVERDLTALAREGRVEEAHGVDALVAELEALLARGDRCPLLVGEAGVGKSALVGQLARRIAEGRVPEPLRDARILDVPLAGVWARSSNPMKAAERLEELLASLAAEDGRTVVFFRDARLLDANLLAVVVTALRARELQFVFETGAAEAATLRSMDEAFASRTHVLHVAEPGAELARWLLARAAEGMEAELGLSIDPEACDLSLRLTSRFLLHKRLPRKAVELLRESATEAKNGGSERVSGGDVLRRFCALTGLPRFLIDDAEALDLDATERFFGERILGQPDAVATVLRSVALLKAGLSDPRRPLGVFLFPGPTGVGKTHLAKLLAEYLFGSGERLVRVNMADYGEEGSEGALFGATWAGEVDAKRGQLTRLLDGKVFAVLLLDEFEKACRPVHDRFLQLFDEGRFINALGETVVCANVLIIATSNVGAEVYREQPVGFAASGSAEDLVVEVDRRIAQSFRAEFLNRFDALCHFRPLGRVDIRRIAQREVGRVLEREGIRTRGLEVDVDPAVVDLLVERGYSPVFGARFLQREIEKTLTSALAVEIARRPLATGTRVSVAAKAGRAVAKASPREEQRPSAQAGIAEAGVHVVRRRYDKEELLAAANDLVHRAEALLVKSGQPQLAGERDALLAASQAPQFWDQPEQAAATLRDFRAVEAKLSELERLRRTCSRAQLLSRQVKTEVQLAAAARAVEEAARELSLAEVRAAAGAGPEADDALLEIAALAPGEPGAAWVAELCRMYLAWAGRRRFAAEAVAEAESPARAVLHRSGPGVRGFLAGERGLHRRLDDDGRAVARVQVYAAPKAVEAAELRGRAREVKRRAGEHVERVCAEAAVADEASGRSLTLRGSLAPGELCALALALLAAEAAAPAEARRYHVGRGARVEDPRTGAGTPRLKDVLRGELDLFIAAFLARPPEARP